MKIDPEICSKKLTDNLNQQIERYGIISALAKRQIQYLENDRVSTIDKLVDKRQYQLDRIVILLREAEGYKKYWGETNHIWSSAQREPVERAVVTLRKVLETIVSFDARLRELLTDKMCEYNEKIIKARNARKFNNAYSLTGNTKKPYYADKKC